MKCQWQIINKEYDIRGFGTIKKKHYFLDLLKSVSKITAPKKNGNELINIKLNGITLIEGLDYVVDDDIILFSSDISLEKGDRVTVYYPQDTQ